MAPSLTSASPGRRERKKLQTRRALHAAALELAAERGFDEVTVKDIADAADVSPRTFFNYFSSKEEAMIGHDPDRAERLRDALLARPAGELPLEALRYVLADHVVQVDTSAESSSQQRALIRSVPQLLVANLAAWTALERALIETIAQRTHTDPQRDLYPALVVNAAIGATRAALEHWRADARQPLTDLLAVAFERLGAGLTPPGRRPTRPRRAGRVSTARRNEGHDSH